MSGFLNLILYWYLLYTKLIAIKLVALYTKLIARRVKYKIYKCRKKRIEFE